MRPRTQGGAIETRARAGILKPEDQREHMKDIGSREEILEWAAHFDAEVEEMRLESFSSLS
jgi:hypothetical protein